jgi:lipopolysaccharide transport system permease protein
VIEAGHSTARYWADLWHYRELFLFLAWRDILVRYKQTTIGVAWALIRPLLTMIVFTVVFGRVAKLPSDGVPYPILVAAGMIPWQFFASSVGEGSNSLVGNTSLVSKVYFPRLIVPTSTIVTGLVDFAISAVILAGLMAWFGHVPTWRILVIPIFVALVVVASLGSAFLLAALNVKYRDFRYVVPFIIQFGLYVSPVGFSSSVVPARWRLLYSANPMVGVIDGFRWAIGQGSPALDPVAQGISAIVAVTLLALGIWYFRRTESEFADVI